MTPVEDKQDQQTFGPNYQKTGHRWIELGMNREKLQETTKHFEINLRHSLKSHNP